MSILDITFKGEETADSFVKESLKKMRADALERREACLKALPALDRLAIVMQGRSGQPYKIRSLLFSMWNGKPALFSDMLGLDWEIRKDLIAVMLAFGYEDSKTAFFYNAIKAAVVSAGQWDWFLEESENLKALEDYVKAARRAKEA